VPLRHIALASALTQIARVNNLRIVVALLIAVQHETTCEIGTPTRKNMHALETAFCLTHRTFMSVG
jgi:hypothetical protein